MAAGPDVQNSKKGCVRPYDITIIIDGVSFIRLGMQRLCSSIFQHSTDIKGEVREK